MIRILGQLLAFETEGSDREKVSFEAITHGTVVLGCLKDASESQCNSMASPLFHKPPNRWPPNLAWMMRPGTPILCKILSLFNRGFRSPFRPLPRSFGRIQSDSASLFVCVGGGGFFLFSAVFFYNNSRKQRALKTVPLQRRLPATKNARWTTDWRLFDSYLCEKI